MSETRGIKLGYIFLLSLISVIMDNIGNNLQSMIFGFKLYIYIVPDRVTIKMVLA